MMMIMMMMMMIIKKCNSKIHSINSRLTKDLVQFCMHFVLHLPVRADEIGAPAHCSCCCIVTLQETEMGRSQLSCHDSIQRMQNYHGPISYDLYDCLYGVSQNIALCALLTTKSSLFILPSQFIQLHSHMVLFK